MLQVDSNREIPTNTLMILARIIAKDILRKSVADRESPETTMHRPDSQAEDNNLSDTNIEKG